MDYSDLFERAWRIVWRNKFMLVLGVLIAVLSGEGDSGLLRNVLARFRNIPQMPKVPEIVSLPTPLELTQILFERAIPYGIAGIAAVILLILLVLIVIGVIAIVARGAIIYAASTIDMDQPITVLGAIRAGWRKAWQLILIATIPPIPITLAGIIIVLIATVMLYRAGGSEFLNAPVEMKRRIIGGLLAVSAIIACPFGLITGLLGLVRHFADRACVLEDKKAILSFRRGWEVLRANAGSALLFVLFQLGIELVARSVLTLPRFIAGFCVLITPLLWVVLGVLRAYFTTLWTLVWRRWTHPPIIEG
jgi:hypothetical protein